MKFKQSPKNMTNTHNYTPFNDEGVYRGMECQCGFIASTGEQDDDIEHMRRHLEDVKERALDAERKLETHRSPH